MSVFETGSGYSMDTDSFQDEFLDSFADAEEDSFADTEEDSFADIGEDSFADTGEDSFADTGEDSFADAGVDVFTDEIYGNVADITFTPDSLFQAAESGQDLEQAPGAVDEDTVLKLRSKLEESGFAAESLSDNEELKALYEYSERCSALAEDNFSAFIAKLEESYEKTLQDLAASKATFRAKDGRLNKIKANAAFDANNKELASIHLVVINIISEYVDKAAKQKGAQGVSKGDIVPAEIVASLLHSGVVNGLKVSQYLDDITAYINTMVPVIINNYMTEKLSYTYDYARRQVMAGKLLQPEAAALEEIRKNAGRLQPVRKIMRDQTGRLYAACAKCGKLHKLEHTPGLFVYFPTESGYGRNFSPAVEKCECGDIFIFPLEDFLSIEYHYVTEHKLELKNAVAQLANLSRGASLLRIVPQLSEISAALPFLVQDISDVPGAAVRGDTGEESGDSGYEIKWNQSEYDAAVAAFYEKLKGFGLQIGAPGTEQDGGGQSRGGGAGPDGKISYSEIAYYVAQCTGNRYEELKMKAFCSLVSFLSENVVFSRALDESALCSLKNKRAFILDNNFDFKLLPKSAFYELVELCAQLYGSGEERTELPDLDDREAFRRLLSKKIPELDRMIKDIEDKREVLIGELEQCIVPLSYCKIVNYQSYPLIQIVSYVSSRRIFDLLNTAADRMIINNLSGEFFEYWKTLNIANKSTITKVLTRETSKEVIRSRLKNMLENRMGLDFGVYDFKLLEPCIEMGSASQEPFHRIVLAVKNCNYYRFCREVADSASSRIVPMGDAYTAMFHTVMDKLVPVAESVLKQKEYEFYLKDFTQEELDANADLFGTLIFSRYVPKRLRDETPEEYVERYNKNVHGLWHKPDEWYDNTAYFDDVEHLVYVSCCSMLYDIGYKNYMASAFMSSFIHMLASVGHRCTACRCLGITDTHLNMISSLKHDWAYEDVSFVSNSAMLRVLCGYYTTSIREPMARLLQEFKNKLVNPFAERVDLKSYFSVGREIEAVFAEAERELHAVDDTADDLENALNEVSLFAADEQFMRSINVSAV